MTDRKPDSSTMAALRVAMNSNAKMANLSKLEGDLMGTVYDHQDDVTTLHHVSITVNAGGHEHEIMDELPPKTLLELCRCDWVTRITPSSHATLCF